MTQILRKIFILIFLVIYDCVAGRLRNKFVHEKDISEHCLRRVMPSVFLARKAVDAYSQVLYFSKVDLPYSCFISVRSESGNNIILVVQLSSASDLKDVCERDPNQLLVYEMGETFGGYWGPQELIKKPNTTSLYSKPDLYTIKYVPKTTQPVTTPESKVSDIDELQHPETNNNNEQLVTESQEFTIEVPLVNVSGQFVPGVEPKENLNFFEDENFDIMYNVRPSPQGAYIATELPLVQFSMQDNSRWGYKEAKNPFGPSWKKLTSDYKLKQKKKIQIPLKLEFKSPMSRYVFYDNTTLSSDISGENGDISHEEMVEQIKPLKFEDDADNIPIEELMSAYNRSGSLTTISEEELEREVSQLLDKLSALDHDQSAYIYNPDSKNGTEIHELTAQSQFLTKVTTTTKKSPFNTTPVLRYSRKENQFKMRTTDLYEKGAHNTNFSSRSAKITSADDNREEFREILSTVTHSTIHSIRMDSINTKKELFKDTLADKTVRPSTKKLNTRVDVIKFTSTMKTKSTQLEMKEKNTATTQGKSIDKPTTPAIQKPRRNNDPSATAGPLRAVDHESWENLVRAAPVMAVRLDEAMPQKIQNDLENNKKITIHQETNNPGDFVTRNNNSKQRAKKKRKKRFIQGIMIEDAKPHNLTTKEEQSTTTASSIEISDIQQFAQLVELVDDDIHDRAALRYLSQYVGRPMFNLCQYEQPKHRYVHLFNSSRLIISIGNFTLRRMQLVITPAKRLMMGKSRCEQSYLECQVNGNRVCIDAMSACDGVANCGETDIYDEDRLMCGGYLGLRHNVCLAAITFLAVLLTLIYMVHYWLGRCVPKVSEAFFIYTEGDENVLYLNSIMRSPNDVGLVIGKSFENFEADVMFTTGSTKESKIYSCIKKCLPCCFKKTKDDKMDSSEWENLQLSPSNTLCSFPEIEIKEMMNEQFKDASVQTGESLEMKNLKSLDKTTEEGKATPLEQSVAKSTSHVSGIELKRAKDELNRLKFFNKTRKDSLQAQHSSSLLDRRQESFTKPSTIYGPSRNSEESEITSVSYEEFDRRDLDKISAKKPKASFSTEADVHTQQKEQSKQLRFNEDVVNIPRDDNDSEEEISALQYDEGGRSIKMDTFEESEQTVPSTSRDFKRFWVGSKGKKKKKKLPLPRKY